MHIVKCVLLAGMALTANSAAVAAEVLVSFEGQRVERWETGDKQWRKLGIFLDGKTAGLKPLGIAAANGKVYVGSSLEKGKGTIETFSPDGRHLGTLARLDYSPQMLAITPDQKWVCVTRTSRVITRYSLDDGSEANFIPGAPIYTRGLQFGPDGHAYVSSAYYGSIAVYDVSSRPAVHLGTIMTYGCQTGFDFGGPDLTKLIVPAQWIESIDLLAGTSDVRYPEKPAPHWCLTTVRVDGEVYAGDFSTGVVLHVPAEPGPVEVVARPGAQIFQMVNMTEAFDGSEARRFAAAKARLDATRSKLFTGVPKLTAGQRDLERMSFNNPDLTVDLSCGIWPSLRICKDSVVIGSTSVPRQGQLSFDKVEPFLFEAPVETTWENAPPNANYKPHDYGFPDAPAAHFRRGNGMGRYWADMNGDGLDDCVEIANDWTEYGVPGPACPVAYDKDEKWTNKNIQAFAYVHFREGKGKDGKWLPPVPILCDGEKFLKSPYGGGGATFADFDGDGLMDMITGDFRSEIWFFRNVGTKASPAFAAGVHPLDPAGQPIEGDLCMMTIQGYDWDADGKVDIVASEEDGRISVFRATGTLKNGVPVFEGQRFLQQKAGDLKFGCLSTPFAVDWDGDGDQDLVCGNSGGYIALIENLSGPGVEYPRWGKPTYFTVADPENCKVKNWLKGNVIQARCGDENSPQGPAEAKWGYTVLSVADWDGDGFLDIMANDVKGSVVWFRNPGKVGTTVMEAPRAVEVEWNGEQPRTAWEWRKPCGKVLRAPWRTTPLMYDWNGDGLMDLLMVDTARHFSFFERAKDAKGRLYLKHPKPLIHDLDGNPRILCGEKGGCGRRKMAICDWDGDGRLDFLKDDGNVLVLLNRGEKDGKTLFEMTRPLMRKRLSGHTNCPTVCDFNGDGVPDLVTGGEDGHFYYFRNPRKPAKPVVVPQVYDVRAYGAAGDGVTKDTEAIQRAIDAAASAGGGTVFFAPGVYVSGTIYLRSNIDFHVGVGATLLGSPDKTDYNSLAVCHQNSAYAGESSFGAHFIMCIEQENVTIRGPGTIDGNSAAFLLDPSTGKGWGWKPGMKPWYGQDKVPFRPSQMLHLAESRNLRIQDIELRNSTYWNLFIWGCEQVQVRGCWIHNERDRYHTHNGDGIDIDSSRYVTVSDCRIRTADDCITLRASGRRLRHPGDCAYVTVANCTLSTPCNCVRAGVGAGKVHDAVFSNITVHDARTAINFVSSWDAQQTDGVDFRNVRFMNWTVDCENLLHFYGGPLAKGVTRTAKMRDIYLDGFSGRATRESDIVGCSAACPIENLHFRNIDVDTTVKATNARGISVSGGLLKVVEVTK